MRVRRARAPLAALVLLAAAGAARPAVARERLAVLIAVAGDRALADDLTEVAISIVAERSDRELVGTRELRGRLAGVVPDGGLADCVARPACLAQVGAVAGADQAVIGTLRRDGGAYALTLSLTDMRTGESAAHHARAAPTDLPGLVAALRDGLRDLFERAAAPAAAEPEAPAPPSPIASAAPPPLSASPPAAPAGPALDLATHAEPGRAGPGTPAVAYVGLGASLLATVAFSAAAIRGEEATGKLAGDTRAEMQMDLQHRKDEAGQANTLLVIGGALTVAAAAALAWWYHVDHARRD
jgi:hypothetical protein